MKKTFLDWITSPDSDRVDKTTMEIVKYFILEQNNHEMIRIGLCGLSNFDMKIKELWNSERLAYLLAKGSATEMELVCVNSSIVSLNHLIE